MNATRMPSIAVFAALLAGFVATQAQAQPTWGSESSPSPTAGGSTSQKTNEAADKAMYKPIDYVNASKPGPAIIVIPGEIKSNNATFVQKFGPNNIADFAELELGKANFKVLERADLGPVLNEFALAYSMGDPQQARKHLQKGKLKTTKWIIKFDILKAEPVAAAQEGFSGGTAVGSVQTKEGTGVWVIGMRYKLLDANTTEQVATGYTEEKMELGAKGTSVLGISSSAQGGLTLDTMVQRLVQKNVWEIDSKYK